MEVGKVSNRLPNAHVNNAKSVSFAGNPVNVAASATENLAKEMAAKFPSKIAFMDKLRCLKGEAGGIIINALGTGLVAPIFIAFNPLSKTDEDTKKYTALRQPVSAVLAVLIQAGLTKPLGDFYDKLANEGKLGDSIWFNQKVLNSDSYIKKLIKQKNGSSADVDAEAAEYSKRQFKNAVEELKKTGTIKFSDTKQLSEEDVRKLLDKTMNDYLESIDKKIEACSVKQVDRRVNRAKLLISQPDITKLCNELLTPNANVDVIIKNWREIDNKKIREVVEEFAKIKEPELIISRARKTLEKKALFEAAVNNCKIIADNADIINVELNKVLSNADDVSEIVKKLREIAKQNGDNPEYGGLSKLSQELEDCCSPKAKKAYAQKIIDRIKNLKKVENNKLLIVEHYQRAYYDDKLDVLKNQRNILVNLQDEAKKKVGMKGFINAVQHRMSGSAMKSLNITDVHGDVVKNLKDTISKRLKGFNQVTNILVGLVVTLPVTCHALNWVYPRFMNVFFPNLANSKKSDAPEENGKKVDGGTKK